jgi:hypothetical protein
MPRVLTEEQLTLAQAAEICGRTRQTVLTWVRSGTRSPRGERVILEALMLPGRWITSREALCRFLAAFASDPQADPGPRELTAAERKRESARCWPILESLGVKRRRGK